MRTRVFIFTLALLLIVQGTAAATPSRTIADLYTVEITKADGTPVPDGLAMKTVPETDNALATLEDIKAVLPAETDTSALQLRELTSMLIPGYTQDVGDLRGKFTFPTRFTAGKSLVVRVGLIDGGKTNWVNLADTANEAGSVVVRLPKALLAQAAAGNAVIAVYDRAGASAANYLIEVADSFE